MDKSQIEITEEQAKREIAKADALNRLRANPDFQLVITQGYLNELPTSIAQNMARLKDGQRTDAQEEILGVGLLTQYLDSVYQKANIAHKALIDAEAARELDEEEIEEDI